MSFLTCFWLLPQKEHFSRSPPSPMRATRPLLYLCPYFLVPADPAVRPESGGHILPRCEVLNRRYRLGHLSREAQPHD